MNIQSNTNNLEMESFYAHVDKAKTKARPLMLEDVKKSREYGKDDDSTIPGGLPALSLREENGETKHG